jgi:hypothetical protein
MATATAVEVGATAFRGNCVDNWWALGGLDRSSNHSVSPVTIVLGLATEITIIRFLLIERVPVLSKIELMALRWPRPTTLAIPMCGPVSATEAIKKEASRKEASRKENSLLGLACFCLNEELFAM